jgi:hypothetical protein
MPSTVQRPRSALTLQKPSRSPRSTGFGTLQVEGAFAAQPPRNARKARSRRAFAGQTRELDHPPTVGDEHVVAGLSSSGLAEFLQTTCGPRRGASRHELLRGRVVIPIAPAFRRWQSDIRI